MLTPPRDRDKRLASRLLMLAEQIRIDGGAHVVGHPLLLFGDRSAIKSHITSEVLFEKFLQVSTALPPL